MNTQGVLVWEVPQKKWVNVRLYFRQLFHALDYVIVEKESIGFNRLDDTIE